MAKKYQRAPDDMGGAKSDRPNKGLHHATRANAELALSTVAALFANLARRPANWESASAPNPASSSANETVHSGL